MALLFRGPVRSVPDGKNDIICSPRTREPPPDSAYVGNNQPLSHAQETFIARGEVMRKEEMQGPGSAGVSPDLETRAWGLLQGPEGCTAAKQRPGEQAGVARGVPRMKKDPARAPRSLTTLHAGWNVLEVKPTGPPY